MAPPTILAHKSTFLTAQTLQLTQALSPSPNWRSANDGAEQGGLPDKVVDDALYRLNHALQQHARRVYAPQASRHVAEQIESLFLEVGERAVARDGGDDDGPGASIGGGGGGPGERRLRVGADFASDENISSLPPTWDVYKPAEAEAHPPEATRYAELTANLNSLSARRREVRERVERLRAMQTLLAPFRAHAQGGHGERGGEGRVQHNLVTRNGEVEKELERMRFLLVRVAGRVAQLPDVGPSERNREDGSAAGDILMQDMDVVERAKVDRLLDNF